MKRLLVLLLINLSMLYAQSNFYQNFAGIYQTAGQWGGNYAPWNPYESRLEVTTAGIVKFGSQTVNNLAVSGNTVSFTLSPNIGVSNNLISANITFSETNGVKSFAGVAFPYGGGGTGFKGTKESCVTTVIPNTYTHRQPGVAVINNKIIIAYKKRTPLIPGTITPDPSGPPNPYAVISPDDKIYFTTSTDGTTWQTPQPAFSSDESYDGPSLAVYNGTLYMCYSNSSNQLCYASYNESSNSWSYLGTITGAVSTDAPSIAVVKNRLYMIYRDSSGRIYSCYFNGTNWSSPLGAHRLLCQGGPALTNFADAFLVAAYMNNNNSELMYSIGTVIPPNDVVWSTPSNSVGGTVELTEVNKSAAGVGYMSSVQKVYAFHKMVNTANMVSSDYSRPSRGPNYSWSRMTNLSSIQGRGTPSPVQFTTGGLTYLLLVYQGEPGLTVSMMDFNNL
ncbi:MAG: hypothetical protein HYS25_09075 [Ignavibacteriales bacterium]|nr:hypothetical protein [Ignavibacteriales bacterium]